MPGDGPISFIRQDPAEDFANIEYQETPSPAQNLASDSKKRRKWYPIARKRLVPYARKHWLSI